MPVADATFARFVAEHGPRYVRLAALLTGSADAEDVVQEAMIALARAWPRVRPDTATAYARRIVVRKALDVLAARRDVPVAEVPDAAVPDLRLLRYVDEVARVGSIRQATLQRPRDVPVRTATGT